MQRQEAKKIVSVLIAAYPTYNPVDIGAVVDVWASMLANYSYKDVDAALKAYILTDTSGFAPSIGQIVDKIKTITEPESLNEMQAWALVSKAIRNGIYGAEEEFTKLPKTIQMAIGSPSQIREWAMDSNFNEAVISSNFMRAYRLVSARERDFSKLPEDMKRIAEDTSKVLEGQLCEK